MAKRDQKESANTSAATHKSRRQAVKTLLAGGGVVATPFIL